MDLWGQALWDYHQGARQAPLYLQTSYGPLEEVPLEEFFKYDEQFPELERFALDLCQGSVLDVGAGTGAHALALQEKGLQVTALEVSKGACRVMQDRGVKTVIQKDLNQFKPGAFDSLLLMMNGMGLAGTLSNLEKFLSHLKPLMTPGGQIIVDSCDVQYLFDEVHHKDYYGNLTYQYCYEEQYGDSFPWLFVDPFTLLEIAQSQGFEVQIVFQDGYQYLARLTQ